MSSATTAMFLELLYGQRSASSAAAAAGGFRLCIHLVERRDGENLLEEAYAKSCKVLSTSKLGGGSSMAQFVVEIPLQLAEAWENGSNENIEWKAAGIIEDDIGAAVPEPEISRVHFDGQSSERCTLKAPAPEPEPPL